jgi:PfaD family protein
MAGKAMEKAWIGDPNRLNHGVEAFKAAMAHVGRPVYVVATEKETAVAQSGTMVWGETLNGVSAGHHLLGFAPALLPTDLGDPALKRDLGIQYAYIAGAMANGITSVEMVQAAGRNGFIGFFGAGGLSLQQVAQAIERLQSEDRSMPFGFNLIHTPQDPKLEQAVVDLYLARGVRLISASAYLGLTQPLVYFRVKGIHQAPDGRIIVPNRVVAKVSRVEVGRRFFEPPPEKILRELVQTGKISEQEALLAKQIPMAQEMTAEADSGGHTDNRPAIALLPTFIHLRDEAMRQYRFDMPLRVGLGGGIATPESTAAAFAMGAAYVLTGSINQSCVEADTSDLVRELLVQAEQADVIMAPAADMFEMGVKVQVLKRGTMFAMRAAKLYDLYRAYDRYDQIPAQTRAMVEKDLLQGTFDQSWEKTRRFFEQRDPSQIALAERDPKHKMALIFRSYLGQASLWAKQGIPSRRMDYQIWCGPAMGAFNAWCKGSFMEKAANRRTAEVSLNLLYGAAFVLRCGWLRSQGVSVPMDAAVTRPLTIEQIEQHLQS